MPSQARAARSRTLGVLAAVVFLGVACGDDSPDPKHGPTATPALTDTPTRTATVPVPPATVTRTASHTPTGTPAGTVSATVTPTGLPTGTATATVTPTGTPAGTVSATFTPTGTPAGTVSPTVTPTCDPCGNGVLGWCEQCDDGNTLDGDCCSRECRFEPNGSPCDDGDPCTQNDACDGTGQCVSEPLCGNGVLDPVCGEECDGEDSALCPERCLFDCTCAPEPTCEADPARIIFAGGPGSSACRIFNGNRRLCEQAFHLGGGGVSSCWYDADAERCQGCGPANQDSGLCVNTCRPVRCAGDETRTVFTGGPTSDTCVRFDGDPAGCATAFALGEGGVHSCWYELEADNCRSCDANALAAGLCVNACAACEADPSRTLFAGGPGTRACRQFDGDQASCASAFHRDDCGNDVSCFYNSNGECRGCGPENESEGNCQNTCAAGPPRCANDPSRTIFAGGPETSACHRFDDDPTSCQKAFHRNQCGAATACYYDYAGGECRGCGRNNLIDGACVDTCASGPLPCANDPSRTVFAGFKDTSDCGNLGLAAGTAACEAGYQFGSSGPESCFMDGSTCTACDPENEADGACANTCVSGPSSCAADPTRTVFAGGPGTSACRQFDGDQAACESAFHRGRCGVASCYYDAASGSCRGCGPANIEDGKCLNTCDPPSCDGDPTRDLFVGGPGTQACTTLNDSPSACARAYHRGADGVASCWYDADAERCRGCGRQNQDAGLCANTCVTCERDPSRTVLAGGPDYCAQFAGNRTACESAFQLDEECPLTVSCFYDGSSEDCRPCDADNAADGRCTNTCANGPPTCFKDPSRTLFAGGESSSGCRRFDGDPGSCLTAFVRGGNGIASCWYDFEEESCRGCGPTNQANGFCINTCLHGRPVCALDPSRDLFAGGPGTSACRRYDGDRATCEKAFHYTSCLQAASCYYDAAREECRGCGPNNQEGGECVDTCSQAPPACALDASRVIFAGGPGTSACHTFDDDRTSCLASFALGKCGVASCFWNGGSCSGCGPPNELNGECFNTCQAP